MPQQAAIFDIDGTLVSFEFDVAGTREALLSELGNQGFDTSSLGLHTPTQLIVDAAKEQVDSGAVSANFIELRARLYSILDGFEARDAKITRIFPKTLETLQYLKSKGVRLAVLTNSGRRAADEVLRKCGISGYFEFVLTRDDVPAMKPRPEGLQMAVSLIRMPPDRVFYVGDSIFDLHATKGAGIQLIAVTTGNYSEDKLRAGGADLVISDISQLPGALGV